MLHRLFPFSNNLDEFQGMFQRTPSNNLFHEFSASYFGQIHQKPPNFV